MSEPPARTGPRRILTTVSGIAASSATASAVSLVRTKAVALAAGASGVGSLALVLAVLQPFTVLFGVGLDSSGTKRLAAAAASGDAEAVARISRSITVGAACAATAGAIFTVLAAPLLATELLGDGRLQDEVRLAGVSLFLALITGSRLAVMQGLRRIRLLAIAAPAGAAVGTVATVAALGAGADPVKAAVVLPFAGEAVVALALSRRLSRPRRRITLRDTVAGIVSLAGLGWIFVINAMLVAVSQLAVRLVIDDELGRSAVGLYQAAFGISAVTSAFVIQALTLDYYPRLSGARSDADAHVMVSEQLRLSLLIAAPAILVAIVAAPALLQIAFSPAFTDAAMTLRWQLVGDLARVAAWTVGFLLVVHEQRLAFVANEAVLNAVWIGATAAFLSVGGLAAAGAAFAFANAAIIPLVLLWARRSAGFRMEVAEGRLILVLVLLAVAVAWLGAHGHVGLVAQVALVLPAAWYSLRMAGRLADTRPSALLRSLRDRSQATAP